MTLTAVVFGSISVDLNAHADAEWPLHHSPTTTGTLTSTPGGKGANEAVALARLGVTTVLVGCVGHPDADAQATFLLDYLPRQGVDVAAVRCSRAHVTSAAVIISTAADGRKLTVSCERVDGRPAANLAIGAVEVDAAERALRRSAQSVLLLQLEVPVGAMMELVARARALRSPVALKPSPLPPHQLAAARRLLGAGVSLCLVNETEAPALLGWGDGGPGGVTSLSDLEAAERAAEQILLRWPSLRTVVVTCCVGHVLRERATSGWLSGEVGRGAGTDGAETAAAGGCVGRGGGGHGGDDAACAALGEACVLPRRVSKVRDVVGAADAFVSGFVGAQCSGTDAIEALAWADAAALLSTREAGAQESLPTRAKLDAFIGAELRRDGATAATALAVGAGAAGEHLLHLSAMRAEVDAVWQQLPGTLLLPPPKAAAATAPTLPSGERDGGGVRAEPFEGLRRKLSWRDTFGRTPLQRASECVRLVHEPGASRRFGATLRQLFCACELLRPSWGAQLLREQAAEEAAEEASPTGVEAVARPPPTPSPPLPVLEALGPALAPVAVARQAAGTSATETASMVLALLCGSTSTEAREREATNRLLARMVCPVLKRKAGSSSSLRTALLSAVAATGGGGGSLLHCAARAGNNAIVRALLECGTPGSEQELREDASGRHALQLAVDFGPTPHHLECVNLLLRHTTLHMDLEACEDGGWRAEMLALHALHRQAAGEAPPDGIIRGPAPVLRCFRVRGMAERASGELWTVTLAEDMETQQPVAIKLFRERDKFEREVRALRQLGDANEAGGPVVPELLDAFELSTPHRHGRFAIVLEEGVPSPLHRAAASHLERRADAERLIQCVHAIHETGEGHVHCDLKPSHFLRFAGRQWRLVDLGSAHRLGHETLPEYTCDYLAPEVAAAHRDGTPLVVTPSVDAWSLGLVLFELFVGRPLLDAPAVARLSRELGGREGGEGGADAAATSWPDDVPHLLARPGGADAVVRELLRNDGGALGLAELDLLRRLLVVDPAGREPLARLLKRTFFRPRSTVELNQITLLGIFCCPKKLPGAHGRRILHIDVEREMRSAMQAIPRDKREICPAARFPEDLRRALGIGELGLRGVSPRILHFSGHALHGGLLVEDGSGDAAFLTPCQLVGALRECFRACHSIECIVLNCCHTADLAEEIHREWPRLLVLSWASLVADHAALAFARGFYSHLGARPPEFAHLVDAYHAAEQAFHDAGCVYGKPDPATPAVCHGKYVLHGPWRDLPMSSGLSRQLRGAGALRV